MKMFVLYFTGILFVLASVGYADEANLNPECLVPPATDVDPSACCKIPELLEESLVDTCAKKVFGGAEPPNTDGHAGEPPFSPYVRCISECIFNETGILKDRQFQPEAAVNQAKKVLGPKHVWLPVVESSVNTCKDFAAKTSFNDKKACGHLGAYLVACINTQLFKNCPASSWTEATGCSKLRETATKCPVVSVISHRD